MFLMIGIVSYDLTCLNAIEGILVNLFLCMCLGFIHLSQL